jgi:hypothetical protein
MPRTVAGVVCLLLPVVATADDHASSKSLLISDCDSVEGIKGLERETACVKQGEAAARWCNHPHVPGFSVPGVPQDWTAYNQLRLWVHNAKPVPIRFMIIIRSEDSSTDVMDYWSYGIRLGFIGWKELVLPIGGKGGTRAPRGWDEVDGITFTASGWSNTPHVEADVVIDEVRLQYDPPRPVWLVWRTTFVALSLESSMSPSMLISPRSSCRTAGLTG